MRTRLASLAGLALAACAPATAPRVDGGFAFDERGVSPQWADVDVRLPGRADDDVLAFVAGRSVDLGVDVDQLSVVRRSTEQGGLSHVRVQQTVAGVPVVGGDVIVHLRGDAVYAVGGTLVDHVFVDTVPAVSADAARDALFAHLKHADLPSSLAFDRAQLAKASLATPKLVVVRTADGDRLAWQSSSLVDDLTAPAQVEALVDAHTGEVFQAQNVLETARGSTTTVTRTATTGSGSSLLVGAVTGIDTASLSTGGFELRDMSGARAKSYVINMGSRQSGGTVATDADNAWGDGTMADVNTVAVDAHYGALKTLDYYKTVHGRAGIDTAATETYSRVHYGRSYANAFWSDSCFCMTYGDGNSSIKPLVSIDVAGHEMSHGVTSRTANLVYSGESGGLNEATSDIFGSMVERYINNAADPFDWLMGEKLFSNGGYIRDMANPTADGVSIDNYANYKSTTDVHYSSGIANKAFVLMSNALTPAVAEKIWYRALTTYFTSSETFAGARADTIRAATDLGASTTAVASAWTAVGVN